MSGEKPSSGKRTQEVEKLHHIDDKKLIVEEKLMIYKGPHSISYEGTYDSRRAFVKRFAADQRVFFEEEAIILAQLKHENIVPFTGIRRNGENCELVTEFLEGGTLRELLESCRWGSQPALPLPQAIGYALDIARAMEYVYQKKFIHRDLKPENVILTKPKDRAVLIDFGHATKEDVNGMTGGVGTTYWMAPEVMAKGERVLYDHKADVYSFSIVLWELITGKRPYYEQDMFKDDLIEGIRTHKIRPNLQDIKVPELATLLKSCWAGEPASRPEFSEIITRLEEILHQLELQRTSAGKWECSMNSGKDDAKAPNSERFERT